MSPSIEKLRVRYTKNGKVRFVGHRDTARIFDRAIRIKGLPVAYTEGFSPRPKVSFGLALSVGHSSDAEYLDIELAEPIDTEGFCEKLNAGLPQGLATVGVARVAVKSTSLQQVVTSIGWRIEILDVSSEEVNEAIKNAMNSDEVMSERTRKGKTSVVNIRSSISELHFDGPTDNGGQISAVLATEPRALRVSELLRALGDSFLEGQVRRTDQWTTVDGVRRELIGAEELVDSAPMPPRTNQSTLSRVGAL